MSQIFPCCCQSSMTSSTISGVRLTHSLPETSCRTCMKFDPQSLRKYGHSPRMASKQVRAILKEAASIDSSISRCTAREYRQVINRTQTLRVPGLDLVFFPCLMLKCPNTSMPQCKKGGVLQSRCSGRSAIFGVSHGTLRVRHWIHEEMILCRRFLHPMMP